MKCPGCRNEVARLIQRAQTLSDYPEGLCVTCDAVECASEGQPLARVSRVEVNAGVGVQPRESDMVIPRSALKSAAIRRASNDAKPKGLEHGRPIMRSNQHSEETWEEIKAAFEHGAIIPDLAVKHGIPKATIYARQLRGGWKRPGVGRPKNASNDATANSHPKPNLASNEAKLQELRARYEAELKVAQAVVTALETKLEILEEVEQAICVK